MDYLNCFFDKLIVQFVQINRFTLFLIDQSECLLPDDLPVLNDVGYALVQQCHVERFGQIIISPQSQPVKLLRFFIQSGEQDDRNMGCLVCRFDQPAEFKSIHIGHHHIGDDQVRHLFPDDIPGYFTIFCGNNFISTLQ